VSRGDTSGHKRPREDAIRSHLVPTTPLSHRCASRTARAGFVHAPRRRCVGQCPLAQRPTSAGHVQELSLPISLARMGRAASQSRRAGAFTATSTRPRRSHRLSGVPE
jgi:hypothetical protein